MLLVLASPAFAGDNLKLNSKLDYTSDSQDGPLITGDSMESGVIAGKPAYVIMYGEGCYNSKRQARRTVSLYEKYKGRVQFVVVDLDHTLSTRFLNMSSPSTRSHNMSILALLFDIF